MRADDLFEDPDDDKVVPFKPRARKPRDAIPDSLKYAQAAHQQAKTAPSSLSDAARDIVLRNLDKIFSEQPLPDADRAQLKAILQANRMIQRMNIRDLVTKVLKLPAHDQIGLQFPNAQQAYLKDDPDLAKYGLVTTTRTKPPTSHRILFDYAEQLYDHVFKHLLDRDDGNWSVDELAKIAEFMAEVEATGEAERDEQWQGPEAGFDPEARPRFLDQESQTDLIPSIEKFLAQFEYSYKDKFKPHIMWSVNPCRLEFSKRSRPTVTKDFPTIVAMEKWIVAHRRAITAWAKADKPVNQVALARRLTQQLVDKIKAILSGNLADDPALHEWAMQFYGLVDYIQSESLQHLLRMVGHDVASPAMWKTFEAFHLEWLPEQVAKRLSQ